MSKYNFFTTNQIKPKGWLKQQLKIQANGLCGNLDKVWKDVRDSAWIGGFAEGWERVPYWLDGFIPLAYLLEDEDMINRGKKYINAIINRQEEDGWICPCEKEQRDKYDTWGAILIAKVLTVYYDCSNDERIPKVIYKILKNYYTLLKNDEIKLFDWAKYRWYETFIAIKFLLNKFNEQWLIDLAILLKEQGVDYDDLMPSWIRPMNLWSRDTHLVNIAMALKTEVLTNSLFNEKYEDKAEKYYALLKQYNGTPVESFTGDECLAGLSPIQGTELCSIVEQMYSYEMLFAHTGENKWAERLEVLAFNALPATLSDDMWAHQYVQLSNQIACQKFPGKPIFRTNSPASHIFGLIPHCGCCTANHGQGWPKFTIAAFMHNENEIINVLPIPTQLNCKKAQIEIKTDYPFKNKFTYNVTAKENFVLKIRVPSFAKNLVINGKKSSAKGHLTFSFNAGQNDTIMIAYEVSPFFEKRPYKLNVAKCGSLVFSIPIEYKKTMFEYESYGTERKYPYCDYEYSPQSEWRYAYNSKQLDKEEREISKIPFSSEKPPIVLKAKVKQINWDFEDGYDSLCAKFPEKVKPIGNESEIELFPYGSAKLRMTELPILNNIIDKKSK